MADRASPGDPGEITRLLSAVAQGNKDALDQVMPLIYNELSRLAHSHLRYERPGHTLNTGALVHEAYLKLVDQSRVEWQSRGHFFAVTSQAMRRILIDYAKGWRAVKRGAGAGHVGLDAAGDLPDLFSDDQLTELIALDQSLERLAEFNPQGARIVQYRFFGGMSNQEVAEVMSISERSVRRSWNAARAWLHRELADTAADDRRTFLSTLT
jgi:RNA polymerase sigma-70 factor, ECF subfamily